MAYYPYPCDSYFVESHEKDQLRLRNEWRESDRQAKQQVQIAIAEQLSQQVSDEYRHDVLQHMERMEVRQYESEKWHCYYANIRD